MTSAAYGLTVCGVFCLLSAWCVLHNKFILQFVFPSSSGLLLVQNIGTVIALLTARTAGFCYRFPLSVGKADIVCGVCYAVNVAAGLAALSYINVPMFGALKRLTVFFSWCIELFGVFRARHETAASRTHDAKLTAMPIMLMLGGTLVASFNDAQFSAVGYFLAALSCACQSLAFELGRALSLDPNKGIAAVLYANCLVSLPLNLFLVLIDGDIVRLSPSHLSAKAYPHFALNTVSLLANNYVTFLNCAVNSPLTHTVAGNVKVAGTSVLGVLLFTTVIKPLGWVGVGANFGGAAWFSWVKYQAKLLAKRQERRAGGVV